MTLEEKLGYTFKDPGLLALALTHRSYANEQKQTLHNERLEFLGDAVIDLVVSDWLFHHFPNLNEGELSKLRASLVNETALAEIATSLGMGENLRLGRGEVRNGGCTKPRLLASAFEALIGAAYCEEGLSLGATLIVRLFDEKLQNLDLVTHFAEDFKTRFQEQAQRRFKSTPSYRLLSAEGPDHDKTFSVEVVVAGDVVACGHGKSKKAAEQEAARLALERWQS